MVSPLSKLYNGVVVIFVAVVVDSFGIVVDLYLWTEFINNLLFFFRLAVCCFLPLDGYIIDIGISVLLSISSPFQILLSLLWHFSLMGEFYLIDQFLLIDHYGRLYFDYFHIGVIFILIEDLSLIVLKSFPGVFVFRMDGA